MRQSHRISGFSNSADVTAIKPRQEIWEPWLRSEGEQGLGLGGWWKSKDGQDVKSALRTTSQGRRDSNVNTPRTEPSVVAREEGQTRLPWVMLPRRRACCGNSCTSGCWRKSSEEKLVPKRGKLHRQEKVRADSRPAAVWPGREPRS